MIEPTEVVTEHTVCSACGSDDVECESYGIRCLTCGYVDENDVDENDDDDE